MTVFGAGKEASDYGSRLVCCKHPFLSMNMSQDFTRAFLVKDANAFLPLALAWAKSRTVFVVSLLFLDHMPNEGTKVSIFSQVGDDSVVLIPFFFMSRIDGVRS